MRVRVYGSARAFLARKLRRIIIIALQYGQI